MNFIFYLPSILLLVAGVALGLSPFLAWMHVQVLGQTLSLPGLCWHGPWLGAVGTGVVLLTLLGRRTSPLTLLLLLWGGRGLWLDYRFVLERGEYVLAQWQLKLIPFNDMLAKVNMEPLQLYQRTNPSDRVGFGLSWAAAAIALAVLGWLLALLVEVRRGASLPFLLFGLHRCRLCSFGLKAGMRYCPGCGHNRDNRIGCSRCGGEMAKEYRFCPGCGLEKTSPQ